MWPELWIYGRFLFCHFKVNLLICIQAQIEDGSKESSPRNYAPLKYLRDQYKRQVTESKGNQVARRKQNQFLGVYTQQQFHEIYSDIIVHGKELDLRLHLDLLMGHFMLLRSQNRLGAELADIFIIPQENEGVHGSVNMLFLLLRQGKVFIHLYMHSKC